MSAAEWVTDVLLMSGTFAVTFALIAASLKQWQRMRGCLNLAAVFFVLSGMFAAFLAPANIGRVVVMLLTGLLAFGVEVTLDQVVKWRERQHGVRVEGWY